MYNKIIAIAADTPISASCHDGVTWVQSDAVNYRWKTIHGSYAGFIYSVIDQYNPYVLEEYATTDVGGETGSWNAGILPTPQLDCIIAVADDADGVFISYDGESFATPQPYVDIDFQRQYGGNKIYQTCSAQSVSNSQFWTNVNAQLFIMTCIAQSSSIVTGAFSRVKLIVGNAGSFASATIDTASTFRREIKATVSSIASTIREFLW